MKVVSLCTKVDAEHFFGGSLISLSASSTTLS